jgi:hypothetical protein
MTKLNVRITIFATAAVLGLGIPAAAFAYDEKDAIRDCNSHLRGEYGLSDFRHESAEQISGQSHSFRVTGKSKVDGEQHGYECEITDRHVTSVRYDGPEPEGLGTAEKLAIGAAAAIAVGAAASAMSHKDDEPAPAAVATAAPPSINTLADGSMEVMVPGGCMVLYNEIGLRQEHGSNCSLADLTAASNAMTSHLRTHRNQ